MDEKAYRHMLCPAELSRCFDTSFMNEDEVGREPDSNRRPRVPEELLLYGTHLFVVNELFSKAKVIGHIGSP